MDAFEKHCLKGGCIERCNTDNGSALRSEQLENITAALGIRALVHAYPASGTWPQGRASWGWLFSRYAIQVPCGVLLKLCFYRGGTIVRIIVPPVNDPIHCDGLSLPNHAGSWPFPLLSEISDGVGFKFKYHGVRASPGEAISFGISL